MVGSLDQLLALPSGQQAARGLTHTPREIAQQPATWRATCEALSSQRERIGEFLRSAGVGSAGPAPTVLLVGAGTSHYIGSAIAAALQRAWRCRVLAVASTDLITNPDDWVLPDQPQLWISFSRSGESAEGVAVLELARERYPAVRHLVVTCNKQGRMLHASGSEASLCSVVLDDAVHDRGLAMTSSFSNMVIAGHWLAQLGELRAFEHVVQQLASMGASFLPRASELASRLAAANHTKVCFLGSGPLKAVAEESALKVLELTAGRVHTMAESFLGVRHGPLSGLDQHTLLVGLVCGNERVMRYEADLLREVRDKNLAAATVAIVPRDRPGQDVLADHTLSVEAPSRFLDDHRVPVDVMFAQLLALFLSIRLGLKPDQPSPNGAISRVVRQITIHR